MRVPYELRTYYDRDVDGVVTVRSSLAGTFGTVWIVADKGRFAAFEVDGLMGDPEPVELASDQPLELHEDGFDSRLIVRTAAGGEHALELTSWDAKDFAELLALAEAGPTDSAAATTAPQPIVPAERPRPPRPTRSRPEASRRPSVADTDVHPRRRGGGLVVFAALLVLGGAGVAFYFLGVGNLFGPDETCGDGIVSTHATHFVLDAPLVTSPLGGTGPVCDDGGSGWNGTFEVEDDGDAPEHGICQALGYDRAIRVTWGGGPGQDSPVMPHAGNWSCSDYECHPGSGVTTDNCTVDEMLLSITCEGPLQEQCDEGELNSDEAGATCRTDCTFPRCGDGVVDGDEACDDGNANNQDTCGNDCQPARCGDGVRQGHERCDDGNTIAGDGCDATCQREAGACTALVIADDQRAAATIDRLLTAHGIPAQSFNGTVGPASLERLLAHSLVIFYHHSRAMGLDEAATLMSYINSGGRLVLTGYDSLGAPTDNVAATVVHLTSEGDGPYDASCRVVAASHPALNGPFGNFSQGTTFAANETDHDRVTTVANPETLVLVALAHDGTPKLTVAEHIGSGDGTAYYWNGNAYANDWARQSHTQNLFLNLLDAECGLDASSLPPPGTLK